MKPKMNRESRSFAKQQPAENPVQSHPQSHRHAIHGNQHDENIWNLDHFDLGISSKPQNYKQHKSGNDRNQRQKPHSNHTVHPQSKQQSNDSNIYRSHSIPKYESNFNASKNYFDPQHHPAPKMKSIPDVILLQNQWQCSQCTMINHEAVPNCEVCASPRTDSNPISKHIEQQVDHQNTQKQWKCTICTMINEMDSMYCTACTHQRVGNGMESTEIEEMKAMSLESASISIPQKVLWILNMLFLSHFLCTSFSMKITCNSVHENHFAFHINSYHDTSH